MIYKVLIIAFLVLNIKAYSQACLGYHEDYIRAKYPYNVWYSGYINDGSRYISSVMTFGTFYYFFNSNTGECYLCTQVPFNQNTLNTIVQDYNNTYVITSDTSWSAYLDNGVIMYIKLIWVEADQKSVFYYTYTK